MITPNLLPRWWQHRQRGVESDSCAHTNGYHDTDPKARREKKRFIPKIDAGKEPKLSLGIKKNQYVKEHAILSVTGQEMPDLWGAMGAGAVRWASRALDQRARVARLRVHMRISHVGPGRACCLSSRERGSGPVLPWR